MGELTIARMSKEVAILIVDGMDEDTMSIHLQCWIAEDFLNHPENYTYEVEEIESLLAEE